jgi:hypothetical protein
MCATPHFAKAVEAAEQFIQEQVERSISTGLPNGRPIAQNPTLAAVAAAGHPYSARADGRPVRVSPRNADRIRVEP